VIPVAKVHLLKLSVGSESVDSLRDWQTRRSAQRRDGRPYHLTRMWPKRADDVLEGGSIYWVIQGAILARQRITGFEEMIGDDGIRRCAIFLAADIVRTEAMRKRPFQGWRYLDPGDAPRDLPADRRKSDELPPALEAALSEFGVRRAGGKNG
jgi:hypothetical protein